MVRGHDASGPFITATDETNLTVAQRPKFSSYALTHAGHLSFSFSGIDYRHVDLTVREQLRSYFQASPRLLSELVKAGVSTPRSHQPPATA